MSSWAFGGYQAWDPRCAIAAAQNVNTSSQNPAYGISDFLAFYPQFTNKVPNFVLTQFISMANATVQQWRWQDCWEYGMALYVAHFATIYLRTVADAIPQAGSLDFSDPNNSQNIPLQ